MSSHFTVVTGYVRQGPDPLGDNGVTFAIPITEKWKKGDEIKEHTEWYNVVVNGAQTPAILEYVKSGSYVTVQGKMRTRKVGDKVYHNLIGQFVDFGPRLDRNDSNDSDGPPF